MTWLFILPVGFLLLIIVFYILAKKKDLFQKLRSFIPYFFASFFISLVHSFLKSGFVSHLFYSETLITVLELGLLFFILVLSVKITIFFIFDFLYGKKQKIKYPRLIKDLMVIILYIIGILLIAKYYLNIQLTVFLASSAVLTVVIGFALQDILGDLFSGITLNLEESLNIGDWIRIGEHEGKIEQFRWRSIKIRTTDNVLVLIPNRIASKEEVSSFGGSRQLFALRLKIGVSYKNSPDFVISTISDVLNTIPAVLTKPKPLVMVNKFDDFAIVYEIKFWLTDFSLRDPVKSEIQRKTWYAFKRNDIQIPFPIRDIYIKDIKKEKIPLSPQWADMDKQQIIAVLQKNEVLNTISQDQLEILAEDIEIMLYGIGETLIKEGEEGRYFYHFLDGEAEVLKNDKVIIRLKANDYVGEMSLFTGEKTTADVRIARESRVLRISSGRFRETVRLNEKMARKLSEVIAQRKGQLMELEKKEDDSQTKAIKKETENIFLRIKKYFSL
jgi:small-conductance mechanosensitive channel